MRTLAVLIATGAAVVMLAGQGMAAGQAGGMGAGGMQGMKQQMMQSPHVKLAMAYKKNLQNFARALKAEVTATGKVDKQFAEQAVGEMRRSFEQMKKQHDEQMGMMSDEMRQQMGDKMKMMQDRLAMAQQHLDQLEGEVKADAPDPKKVVSEVNQILNQCDMMKMEGMQKKKKRTK